MTTPVDPYKNAKRVLFLAVMAMGFGQTILFAVLAPLGREIGLMEIQIGAMISASSLTVFIFSPIWGRVSDDWGRRKVILIGLFGYTLGSVIFNSVFSAALMGLMAPMTAYVGLVLARIANAGVMAATMPASSAYMADITDLAGRTKGMGAIGAANNMGAILGPAVGGALTIFGLVTPLWFAAFITLLGAVLVLMTLPNTEIVKAAVKPARLKYSDPRILPFIFVGVFMFMGFAIVQQTMAFRFQDILSLSANETAQVVGIGMMLSALCSVISQMLIIPRLDVHPFTLLKFAMPILIGAFAMMAVGETRFLLTAAMALQGLGMGLAGPGFMAGASLAVTPEEQGAVAGVAGSCGPLGFTIGPLIGTSLYAVQPDYPYWFTFLIYIPLFVFTLRVKFNKD